MTPAARAGGPFLAIGFAFIAIGASRQGAFMVIGIAFIVIGIVRMTRAKRP
jgi:hypothetical protein